MPNIVSKVKDALYDRDWSFPYNCYEVGHGWTPFCTGAACDVGMAAFRNAIPLYSSLYLFTQIGLQRKFSPDAFMETAKSTLISASFLGFNFFSGIGVSCLLRNNSDRYYFRIQCLLPGFIASYLALLIERPSRRPALAFYLANMSSELLYKSMRGRGYVRDLPHGETFLFALGMACWLRFVRIHGFGHDPVSTAVKYLIGPYEAKSRARVKSASEQHSIEAGAADEDATSIALTHKQTDDKKRQQMSRLQEIDKRLNELFSIIVGCHETCPHKGESCLHYSLTPTFTRFGIAYAARSCLNLVGRYRLLLKSPGQALSESFLSKNSLNFGLFLGTFVGLSKATHCILRRTTNCQQVWHSAVAGGVSGLSMLFAPKSTLSTYVIWKCLEQYFFLGVKNGIIIQPDQAICLVYAISVNIMLITFALEPRYIRPSYMKFIDSISDHKLHQVNRMVLDVFGTGASEGYEDWFPNLDPKHMSREFQELIFNWLIQPYE